MILYALVMKDIASEFDYFTRGSNDAVAGNGELWFDYGRCCYGSCSDCKSVFFAFQKNLSHTRYYHGAKDKEGTNDFRMNWKISPITKVSIIIYRY